MRDKIALTRLQRLRNTDPIFYDHVIEAVCEEIEKVMRKTSTDVSSTFTPYRSGYCHGFEEACQEILSLLRPVV
ncbi:unnamed protein product [marine sediment metagenome]|uniref:Uncharacterized protein n=1 Tax=marine sediment metagenome TaxID=412755 RepID=X1GJ28_9ZZZZ